MITAWAFWRLSSKPCSTSSTSNLVLLLMQHLLHAVGYAPGVQTEGFV